MIRHLHDTFTSHGTGIKRVLLAANESACSLTQIAVTELKTGETAAAHVHPDMQEAFYVMSGELQVTLDGEKHQLRADDFVYVEQLTNHELHAITDVRVMTIGCVIEAHRNKLYRFLFNPNRKTLVWGTEDWTVSAVNGSVGEIENGTWARYQLTDVIQRMPEAILGKAVARKYNNQLPLLTKVIDAHQDLSSRYIPMTQWQSVNTINSVRPKCGMCLMPNQVLFSMPVSKSNSLQSNTNRGWQMVL